MQKQQEYINQLIELVKENPTLRVVPMVQTDVVASNEFSWWVGGIGNASIEEIYFDGERNHIRSIAEDDLISEEAYTIECILNYDEEKALERARQEIAAYDWKKVIAVKIGLPV